MEHEVNKAIVRLLYEELFNPSGDLGVIDEFVAVDFVDHTAPPGLLPGREGLRTQVAAWRRTYPAMTLRVVALLAEADTVAVTWTDASSCRDRASLGLIGAAGGTSGVTINRLADGRIVERWNSSVDHDLLQRLGG